MEAVMDAMCNSPDDKFRQYVVEDMSELHGVKPHALSDAACWSFYRNKIVAGEEGGAVVFHNREHAAHARQLRSLGFTEAHDFMHVPGGHNYRMSNVHALLILESLKNYEWNEKERRNIELMYNDLCPIEWRMPERQAVWVYDFRIPGLTNELQTSIVKTLNSKGITARHAFKPMSIQPEFRQQYPLVHNPVAAQAAREVIYLPVQPGMTTETIAKKSFEIIQQALDSSKK